MGARKQVDRISPSPPLLLALSCFYDTTPPPRSMSTFRNNKQIYMVALAGRGICAISVSSKQPSIKFSPNCIKGHRIKTYPSGSKTIIGGSQQSMLFTKQSAPPPSFHSQTNGVSLGGARHKCYFDCLYITPSNR